MKKLRVFRWLLMATLAASLPITAQAADGHSVGGPMRGGPISRAHAVVVSHFTMAASKSAASLFTTVYSGTTAASPPISRSSGLASLTGTQITMARILTTTQTMTASRVR
jgi:hypothetical protein